jgi:hypothetical protein
MKWNRFAQAKHEWWYPDQLASTSAFLWHLLHAFTFSIKKYLLSLKVTYRVLCLLCYFKNCYECLIAWGRQKFANSWRILYPTSLLKKTWVVVVQICKMHCWNQRHRVIHMPINFKKYHTKHCTYTMRSKKCFVLSNRTVSRKT